MNSNAPTIIYATVNGASTDLFSGRRQLIGGWREADNNNPRATRYVRDDEGDRPCTMDQYVAALRSEGLSASLVYASVGDWLKGDYETALRPLAAHARARLTGKGGDA